MVVLVGGGVGTTASWLVLMAPGLGGLHPFHTHRLLLASRQCARTQQDFCFWSWIMLSFLYGGGERGKGGGIFVFRLAAFIFLGRTKRVV